MCEAEVEEHHYRTHAAAMRAMRRRLLVMWHGKVEHYRMGVNHLSNDPWRVMSHEVKEGSFQWPAEGLRQVEKKAKAGSTQEGFAKRKTERK